MNLESVMTISAAANPFPLKTSFEELAGGGHKCKLCGEKVSTQGGCADHLLMKHRTMASAEKSHKMCSCKACMNARKLKASGTSEGVKKAWDTRGRIRGKAFDELMSKQPKAPGEAGPGNYFKCTRCGKDINSADNPGFIDRKGLPVHSSHSPKELEEYKKANNGDGYKLSPKYFPAWHKDMKGSGIEARDFSEGRRKKLAKSGKAMPGGGFPIVNKEDLTNARRAIGRAKNPTAARAHIRERAKALGVKLSDKWKKGIKADQFSPADRLRMPPQKGTTQRTVGAPGIHFSAEPLIRQRPGGPKRKVGQAYRGSQIVG